MGFSLSWLAVKGKSPLTVRDELGFQPTGEREAIPESELSAAELPNGWYLIVTQHTDRVVGDDLLRQLTAGCEAVTCSVEEHVMYSDVAAWKDGNKCCSVVHDTQKRRGHLETHGELPPVFESIRQQLETKQQDADKNKQGVDFIFDIPVNLAAALTGYRYDKDVPGLGGKPFEVLVRTRPLAEKTGSQGLRLSDRWLALSGWKKCTLGVLIILGAFIIMSCLITFVVMLFT